VVETGSHQALLAQGGRYAMLYRQQFAGQGLLLTQHGDASVA
jgi:hypothetical protein